jgi:hypothetical protein
MAGAFLETDDGASDLITCISGVSRTNSGCSLGNTAHDQDLFSQKTIGNFEIVIVLHLMDCKQSLARNTFVAKEVVIISGSGKLIVAGRHGGRSFLFDRIFADRILS